MSKSSCSLESFENTNSYTQTLDYFELLEKQVGKVCIVTPSIT